MAIKLTNELINKVNIAMSESNPHGGLFLRKGAFGDAEVVFHDHYIADVNGLWNLYKELGLMIDVFKKDIGIYQEV